MRITSRNLRKIIRESLKEGFMKERWGEIEASIISALEDSPGLGGMEIVTYVISDTSSNQEIPTEREEVFSVLDDLQDDGVVYFNVEEDEWYLEEDTRI